MKLILGMLLLLLSQNIAFSQGSVSDTDEKQALLDLYFATTSSNSNWIRPWNVAKLQDPATLISDFTTSAVYSQLADLPGVTIANGDVVTITLNSENNIKGSIPSTINNLVALTSLTIQSNYQSASSSRNEIRGQLPSLSGLVNLEVLDLRGNNCTGVVDWLGASNKMRNVNLSSYDDNGFGQRLTILPTALFGNLTALTDLTLNYNVFSTIENFVTNRIRPEFGGLSNLKSLSLIECSLNDNSFPVEFSTFTNLETLDLSGNVITNLPSPIGDLMSLETLNLNSTLIEELSSNFHQLDQLYTLHLQYNRLGNTGSVGARFYNMVELLKGCSNLTELYLTGNYLTDVSSNFYQITSLRFLELSLNPIAGSDLSNLNGSKITSLSMQACQLTSKLPFVLTSLSDLTTLNISNEILGNDWSSTRRNWIDMTNIGVESVLKSMSNLKSLSMRWHAIAGPAPLPVWFGTGNMNKLETLDISYNQVQLPLPDNFQFLSSLSHLNMSYNSLNGPLPDFIKELRNLKYFNASNNELTSPFPGINTPSALTHLDISHNKFTGEVPSSLLTLPSFQNIIISNNEFASIPDGVLNNNVSIYLRDNLFDFDDLKVFYHESSCVRKIQLLDYAPQKPQGLKGEPGKFYVPEGMQVTIKFKAPGDNNNYYQWERNNGAGGWNVVSPQIVNASSNNVGIFHTKIMNRCLPGLEFTGANVEVLLIPPLCQSEIPAKGGVFKMDKLTGAIVFERADCNSRIPVTCVFGPASTIDNVVAAKAITHSDDWSYSYLNPSHQSNPFEGGERGKWRPKANYVYNTSLEQSNDKNFNGGTFKYKPFNWKSGEKSNYPGWVKVNQIEKYSPNGDVTEEVNALNVSSTAKFGYKETVPYLIAQNAEYQSVLFESFENLYGDKFEDGFLNNGGIHEASGIFHSGRSSYKLSGSTSVNIRAFRVNNQFKNNGVHARIWARGNVSNSLELQLTELNNNILHTTQFTWVANSGEWSLYECYLPPAWFIAFNTEDSINLRIRHTGGNTIWIDDVRVQPKDAEIAAYVYDATNLRLLTVFDDQHFGLFYQYNAEGKLIRKIIETERGIKTVQETQYNVKAVGK
ncbi:leucine-rich repeat domain-containing protein [Chryseosolibacter indicus]|uniref:Disease resistance R13L4/SHOC-2-like LRR domain-containing protein n=1 Tax=Chryseosolibacter indicus TaxID=2782351 RepID=A0ABS5VYJ3_9BACT|nr:leucine-rich repeat domain-containing protein [Chryseosolibacter indicus]MBT1706371.1 hypothetical protein [Chryseosolibacter indicus]